jgi:ComF family protein
MSLFALKSNEKGWLNPFSDFARLFFPECCLGCAAALVKGEEILCTRCILDLPRSGYPFTSENDMKDKFIGRLPVKYAGAFLKFRKTGIVQHLLHQLKYNNHGEIGIRLGKLFGLEMKKLGLNKTAFDVIIPMPLHVARQRKRGYNQSTKFAEGLMQELDVACQDNIVVRHIKTATQTRKNKAERWENVKQAFRVQQPGAIRDKSILLVDDIITTGASLEACGLELVREGCREISVACIAEAQ